MTTEIKTWEIVDGVLRPLDSKLADHGRLEALDLESWLDSDSTIIRPGLKIIGRQVVTRSGPLDLLAIDEAGNLVVIELKRDKIPRDALAQAIDYASDVATWSLEKLGEVCAKHTGQGLEDVFSEAFPDADLDGVTINGSQRIVLVGFAVEDALERMIQWLSEAYGVGINAVVLKYVRTESGSEILTRAAIISEQVEETRVKKHKFTIPMSDDPGTYEPDDLRERLTTYLTQSLVTAQRIRDVMLPVCLARRVVTRSELKEEFVRRGVLRDPAKVGYVLSLISVQVGMEKNDFLRQVIGYEYPNYRWEKDNYCVREQYRDLVASVLKEAATLVTR